MLQPRPNSNHLLPFGSRGIVLLAACVIFVCLVGVVTLSASAAGSVTQAAGQSPTVGQALQPLPVVDTASGLYTQIYEQGSRSVVAINVYTRVRGGQLTLAGSGSGFVVDTAGHIMTNNHVISGANFIEVELADGTLAEAQIVGADANSDLAVLSVSVPAEKLVPVTFGDSNALVVGETVLAIGSPFGQDWTLTTGIVSGIDRVIQGLTEFSIGAVIQTDAAINPGNSGGPLLNLNGQVIGVNSQILSRSGSNSGVGFAIPSNLVQRVMRELIEDGRVDYSYIGISGTDLSLVGLTALGLSGDVRGVLVSDAVAAGPAARAGLQRATNQGLDIITAVDGRPVTTMDDLISYLARETLPGQSISLSVLRRSANGSFAALEIPVTLSTRP